MRERLNVYLPSTMLRELSEIADKKPRTGGKKKVSRSAIVEAAVASYLSPDGADRKEAAYTRRLDRLSRQLMRLERNVAITAETVALFVRFWLIVTPPLPPEGQNAAQTKGRERFEGFIETLGRRLQSGESFLAEIPNDIPGSGIE